MLEQIKFVPCPNHFSRVADADTLSNYFMEKARLSFSAVHRGLPLEARAQLCIETVNALLSALRYQGYLPEADAEIQRLVDEYVKEKIHARKTEDLPD